MTFFRSLTNRIFVAAALLAVVTVGAAIFVVNLAVRRQAERELQRGLQEAGALLGEYRTMVLDQVVREARLIADLPRLKSAAETDDPPTVRPIAEEYHQPIGSDLFVVTGKNGKVLAAIGARTGDPAVSVPARLTEAPAEAISVSFWARPDGVLQVVTVPIWIGPARPEIFGTLSVGASLDEAMARRFRALTNSEIAFALDGRVLASTLGAEHRAALDSLLVSSKPPAMRTLELGSEEFLATVRPLVTAGAKSGGPVAVILRSRTEQLRLLRSLYSGLAVTAVVAVLAATLLSYMVARTITKPLGAITAAMREMAGTGDLTRPVSLTDAGAGDEDARLLARTFNTLTASVVKFQREAAQRERLSALGRLSTVVAHEIRNPLMIIKTALRPLRRADLPPDQLHAAVDDIDDEVARLNRIVNEVLDFARPIRFEVAPTDLRALGESAVAAVSTPDAPAVRLVAPPGLPAIDTDGERLRQALVNILANAQDAVAARDGDTRPPVELRMAASGGKVSIAVRDEGVGIAPEDLPRVFDPYFTTRRTGSGLGLAIARNIIEGLGGTISVSSRPGAGTEITIAFSRAEARQHV
jgi:signal transduction histidine kinase